MAFADCGKLTEIDIPKGVTDIGAGAFESCKELRCVTFPDTVTEFGSWLFSKCEKLAETNIPHGVKKIGAQTFGNCRSLKSINIPDSVVEIDTCAFDYCSGLTSINIPGSVVKLGAHVFRGCSGLEEITIPDSVKTSGEDLFWGCTELKKITLPYSISYALFGGPKVETIEFTGEKGYNSWMKGIKKSESLYYMKQVLSTFPQLFSYFSDGGLFEGINGNTAGTMDAVKDLLNDVTDRVEALKLLDKYGFIHPKRIAQYIKYSVSKNYTDAVDFFNNWKDSAVVEEPKASDVPYRLLENGMLEFGGQEWRILEKKEGKMLILKELVLPCQAYHEADDERVTWENSEMRAYLNGEYFNNFSAREQSVIVSTTVKTADNAWRDQVLKYRHYDTDGKAGEDTDDKIFVLSIEETVKYFGDSGRILRPVIDEDEDDYDEEYYTDGIGELHDEFSESRMAENEDGEASGWWLRSPGFGHCDTAVVTEDGIICISGWDLDDVDDECCVFGARPAMWIKA